MTHSDHLILVACMFKLYGKFTFSIQFLVDIHWSCRPAQPQLLRYLQTIMYDLTLQNESYEGFTMLSLVILSNSLYLYFYHSLLTGYTLSCYQSSTSMPEWARPSFLSLPISCMQKRAISCSTCLCSGFKSKLVSSPQQLHLHFLSGKIRLQLSGKFYLLFCFIFIILKSLIAVVLQNVVDLKM